MRRLQPECGSRLGYLAMADWLVCMSMPPILHKQIFSWRRRLASPKSTSPAAIVGFLLGAILSTERRWCIGDWCMGKGSAEGGEGRWPHE